jgi:hypothetical protein
LSVDAVLLSAPPALYHGLLLSHYTRFLCVRGRDADASAVFARLRALPLWAAPAARVDAARAGGGTASIEATASDEAGGGVVATYCTVVLAQDDGIFSLIRQKPTEAVGAFEAAVIAARALVARAGAAGGDGASGAAGGSSQCAASTDAYAALSSTLQPVPVLPSPVGLLLEACVSCAVACARCGAGSAGAGVALLEALVRSDPARHTSAEVTIALAALYDATRDATGAAIGKRVLAAAAARYGVRHLEAGAFRLTA